MRKLFSIVLTLALLVSCIVVTPIMQTSAEAAVSVSDEIAEGTYTTLLDTTNATNADWIAPLETGEGARQNTYSFNETTGAVDLGAEFASANILTTNEADTSSVKDFVWQFDFAPKNAEQVRAKFLFHTTESSVVINQNASTGNVFNSITKTYAIYVAGSKRTGSGSDYLYPGGLYIEAYNGSNMRPVNNYYTNNGEAAGAPNYSPKEYIPLDMSNDDFYTIKISMTGKNLVVEAWKTGDTATKQTLSITVGNTFYNQTPKSGDFAISLGDTSNTACSIKNMVIKRPSLVFDSSVDAITQNPGNSAQNNVGGEITSSDGVYTMPVYSATDELIEASIGGQANISDFVWETEFSVNGSNANYAILSFDFHVDKNRTDSPSKLPGDTDIGIGNSKRQNMISATVYGEAIGALTTDQNAAGQSAVVLQSSSTASTTVAGCSTATITKDDSTTIKRATSFTPLSKALAVNTNYTIRIVLSGKNLYTYIWETDNKSATLRSVYQTLTAEQFASAPSGDFAIVVDNRAVNIKNTKIWDTVNVIRSVEDYSAYTDVLAPTVYDFENEDFGSIEKGAGQDNVNLSIYGGKLQLGDDDDTARVTAINFDGGNRTLRDFVVTFDYSTAAATGSDNNWLVDRFAFRDIGASKTSQYRLEINRQGRSSSNQNYDIISIVMENAGTTETLASASLSRSLNYDTNYKIKLEVIGNVFKVYVAVDDVFTTPVIVCTDDTFAEGLMYWYHNRGITYIDNLKIYDITATEVASEIKTVTSDIKRGMDGQIDSLYTVYNSMHSAQQAKLAEYKATLDAADETLYNLEMLGHDVNATSDVDICDIVAMSIYLDGVTEALKNADADPLFDGELNDNDVSELRLWLLGSKKKITNILCIGNSYTQDTMTYVAQLADSMGIEDLHFANLYSPGRDIEKHYSSALGVFGENHPELLKKYENNSYYKNGDYLYWYETYTKDGRTYKEHTTIKEALLDKEWDIVFFQTSPTGAAFTNGFKNLDKLMDFVRKYEGDDVKFMWHNSWAYATLDYDESFAYDDAVETTQCTYEAFKGEDGNYSQEAMHNLIVNKFATLFGEGGTYADSITIDDVIPSGMAIQNARESGVDFKVGDEKYWDLSRDGYHLSKNMGRYIGSLTLIRHFTGEELVYSDNLFRTLENGEASEEQVKAAINAVNDAFAQREMLK